MQTDRKLPTHSPPEGRKSSAHLANSSLPTPTQFYQRHLKHRGANGSHKGRRYSTGASNVTIKLWLPFTHGLNLCFLLFLLRALMSHKPTATWPDMKAGDKSFARTGKILHKIFQKKKKKCFYESVTHNKKQIKSSSFSTVRDSVKFNE